MAVSPKARALCARPYPNHPRGCPKLGTCLTCPPRCRLITDVLDLSQPTFVIYTELPLGKHVAKLKAKHPDWTQRQLACCLYWQTKGRQNLLQATKDFVKLYPSLFIAASPEAIGHQRNGDRAEGRRAAGMASRGPDLPGGSSWN